MGSRLRRSLLGSLAVAGLVCCGVAERPPAERPPAIAALPLTATPLVPDVTTDDEYSSGKPRCAQIGMTCSTADEYIRDMETCGHLGIDAVRCRTTTKQQWSWCWTWRSFFDSECGRQRPGDIGPIIVCAESCASIGQALQDCECSSTDYNCSSRLGYWIRRCVMDCRAAADVPHE